LYKILKDLTSVLDRVEHLEVCGADDINLQPFVDAQPGKLEEITLFGCDCENKIRFAQHIDTLGITALTLLSDQWGSPWNDGDAVRTLIPSLVCYEYSG